MQAGMAFENAPPFMAPLRFFLTAPLFAALAGLLIAVDGGDLFASRWTPGALAATHLITVGFMLQTMLGALIQILPVLAGVDLVRPLWLAQVVHLGLSAGALLLVSGFLLGQPLLLSSAALVLCLSVLIFLTVVMRAMAGVPSTSPTIRGIKFALFGLAGVVGLGAALALALANGWAWPLPALADLHAGWGLGGWAGVLLAAMAYVVVPMFQLTPAYPMRSSWWFPVVMLGMLLTWTLGVAADWQWLGRLSQLVAASAGIAFAGLTLRLQSKRRRARADATYRYWQLGLGSCIFALFLLLTAAIWPAAGDIDGWAPGFGVLLLAGGFLPLISGMLYKILPFLAWLHLQSCGMAKVPAPAMNKLLPDAETQRQMQVYVLAFALLLGAVIFPGWLARPAGLFFALANGWLFWNLWGAVRRYRQAEIDIKQKLAAK